VPQKGSNSLNSLSSSVGAYNNLNSNSNNNNMSSPASSSNTSPNAAALNTGKPRRARTLYPCQADNPTELSFEQHVIIYNGKLYFYAF
jgi:hypothetical protein